MKRGDAWHWRVLATGTCFAVFGLAGLVLGYGVFPVIHALSSDRPAAIRRCRLTVHGCFRGFVALMQGLGVLTWEVQGREQLRRPGQLVVANHPSLIDIVFLIGLLPNATCIAKSRLFHNPFTRGPLKRAGYVPNNGAETLLADCAAALASGATLVVFPQGTRTPVGESPRFRRGAAHLCLRTRARPILVGIEVSPPTLAKGEKWYQVPPRRPHFHLRIRGPAAAPAAAAGHCARALTREWQQYFTREISL